MEQAQQEKVYMERLPLVAMQIRSALGNIYYGMQKLAPADERDEDPILDANAAMLYHGYFRLLRLAKNLESASMLNRKELLPTENTDLKVWLDEIIREAEVPFELKGVQLEMVCEERYAITAVNEPWLSQALWQLLSNALKYTPRGGTILLELAHREQTALITLSDHGEGMDGAALAAAFSSYTHFSPLGDGRRGIGFGHRGRPHHRRGQPATAASARTYAASPVRLHRTVFGSFDLPSARTDPCAARRYAHRNGVQVFSAVHDGARHHDGRHLVPDGVR